jgi:hypothetical protein
MDGDRCSKQKNTRQIINNYINDGNVFQPSWIRRLIQSSDGLDRVILDYGFNFLPYISLLFYIILFIKKIL